MMAVGTGLGTAAIIWDGNKFIVTPLEGGHAIVQSYGLKHPEYEEEKRLFDHLSCKRYNGEFPPEVKLVDLKTKNVYSPII